jgi:hypothetical protein
MEAVTKPAPSSADRVLEALATLSGLLERTMNEVKSLDGDYQGRLLRAVQESEESLQSQVTVQIEKAVAEITASLKARFESEQKAALENLRSEYETELARVNQELTRTSEAVAILEMERSRIAEELDRAQQEAKYAAEAASKVAAAPAAGGSAISAAAVEAELAAGQAKLRGIMDVIEDPATELSVVIRKNVERSDLEAYLRGIRFVAQLNGK